MDKMCPTQEALLNTEASPGNSSGGEQEKVGYSLLNVEKRFEVLLLPNKEICTRITRIELPQCTSYNKAAKQCE